MIERAEARLGGGEQRSIYSLYEAFVAWRSDLRWAVPNAFHRQQRLVGIAV